MIHKSLKAQLKRSNYTLDHAIVTLRAGLDIQKMTYITSNCKNLRRLEIRGSGLIGDSLTKSVPYARNLGSIFVSSNSEITASAVQKTLTSCCKTITEATFLCVTGSFNNLEIPQLDSLQKLHLKAASRRGPALEIVGSSLFSPYDQVYASAFNIAFGALSWSPTAVRT